MELCMNTCMDRTMGGRSGTMSHMYMSSEKLFPKFLPSFHGASQFIQCLCWEKGLKVLNYSGTQPPMWTILLDSGCELVANAMMDREHISKPTAIHLPLPSKLLRTCLFSPAQNISMSPLWFHLVHLWMEEGTLENEQSGRKETLKNSPYSAL